ncbi:hypothetical protein ACQ4PT_070274 [Festuca glaucescens]
MDSIAEEILREILLKLPTRDVARCRGVCWQWRRLLTDPPFLTLHGHAAHVVSGAGAEALLVSKSRNGAGMNPEIVLFNLSSAMSMCRFADLDAVVYSAANVCNGFLCLVCDLRDAPVVLCNPVTGEKLGIPAPPVAESISAVDWQVFAMGFSPSTRQYKLFRLSFPKTYKEDVYMDVCTLGDDGEWRRRRPRLNFSRHEMRSWPVLIDGKLYLVTKSTGYGTPLDGVLAIDVASEVVHAHGLPKKRTPLVQTAVDAMELHGRLCVAVHELDAPRPRLTFWVLMIDLHLVGSQNNDGGDGWEMRYNFDIDAQYCSLLHCHSRCQCHPRGAWLQDSDGVLWLCYLTGGRLYKYDTTAKRQWQYPSFPASNKVWDHRLRLPPSGSRWWNVYGGYRPSLLSPRHLASSSSSIHHHELPFEHPLLRTMRCRTPSNKWRRSSVDDGTSHRRATKRRPTSSFPRDDDGTIDRRRAAKRRPTLSFLDDLLI